MEFVSLQSMNHDYLSQLNDQQLEAVVNFQGPTLVIAGAGSGKTRVLTYRIAHLLANNIPPHKILALTFTNKAATEMRERIAALVGSKRAKHLWMGTFHSIFARILRIESERLNYTPDFTIYDTQDSQNLIKLIVKERKLHPQLYKPNLIYSRISRAKNNLITPAIYTSQKELIEYDRLNSVGEIYLIYKIYQKRLRISNAMDFDDLLLNMNILLRDNSDLLAKYQNRFDYILVDEYQDTNYSQYRIIRMLSAKHRNICVVGDDAQSIYAFRGARIENIFNFQNDYPDLKIIKLEQNYRSTQNIVNAANHLIAHNTRQLPKTVFSQKEPGELIRLITAQTDTDEGFRVVQQIEEDLLNHNLSYRDIAILYRINAQSRIFEEVLRRKNIPYKIWGGTAFYQRKEIKDALAYFKLTVNHYDDQALLRVINYPARGIGDTTLAKIEQVALANNAPIWTVITSIELEKQGINRKTLEAIHAFYEMIQNFRALESQSDAYSCAIEILRKSGMLQDLEADKTNEGISRYQNIEELLRGINDFALKYREENQTIGRLSAYLEEVSLLTEADTEKAENVISLMTVHASKGLEFPSVYIVGLEEQLFPSQLSMSTPESIEEERRLFYVAITRAQKLLTLSWARHRTLHGGFGVRTESRFIDEIPAHFLSETGDNLIGTKISLNGYTFNTNNLASFESQKTRSGNQQTTERKQQYKGNFSIQSSLQRGQKVLHPVFGPGTVVAFESLGVNSKARIRFNDTERVLLLRFAKLQIL